MLSVEEVKNIALLARIGLKEEEIAVYQKDLSAVLDFFRELETVPTDNVAPIRHITGTVATGRSDRTLDFDPSGKERLRENMPDMKDGFLKVRSVF